jgi:uncharacterized protein YndB with AHSA1/START domain
MDTTEAGETIVQEITIKAPAERIFEALTDPDQRVKWWGTGKGFFKSMEVESDLRPGGRWAMRGTRMDGKPFSVVGVYRTIERPRLIAFTWLPDWQADASESLVRFDLDERDGATRVRVTHSGLTPANAQAHRGWPQILDWLKAYSEG